MLRLAKAIRSWQAFSPECQRRISEHQRLPSNHCHYVGAIHMRRMHSVVMGIETCHPPPSSVALGGCHNAKVWETALPLLTRREHDHSFLSRTLAAHANHSLEGTFRSFLRCGQSRRQKLQSSQFEGRIEETVTFLAANRML
jgi:hypothetical protein